MYQGIKLTIKKPEWSHWRHSGFFIVNLIAWYIFDTLFVVLLFLLLTLNIFYTLF